MMFEYLIEKHHLMGEFNKYGLMDQDIEFIKEQIAGPKVDEERAAGSTEHEEHIAGLKTEKSVRIFKFITFLIFKCARLKRLMDLLVLGASTSIVLFCSGQFSLVEETRMPEDNIRPIVKKNLTILVNYDLIRSHLTTSEFQLTS